MKETMTSKLQTIRPFAGLVIIVAGVLILVATRIPSLASSNGLLLTGLLLIVAGIVVHILLLKKDSKY
jgi:uncharacterized membrane protein HdeD (DUF308 family)